MCYLGDKGQVQACQLECDGARAKSEAVKIPSTPLNLTRILLLTRMHFSVMQQVCFMMLCMY